MRLVVGIQFVAKGFALGVEHAGRQYRRIGLFGVVVCTQFFQHADHAVYSAGRFTGSVAQVGQGVIGAIQITGTINKKETRHHD